MQTRQERVVVQQQQQQQGQIRQQQEVQVHRQRQMEMQAAAQHSFGEQRAAEPLAQPLPSRVQQQEEHNRHLLLQQLSKHKLFTGAARPFPLFRPEGRPRVYSFSGVVSSSTAMSEELSAAKAGEVRCCSSSSPVASSVSLAFRDIRAAVAAPFPYASAAAAALPSPYTPGAAVARAGHAYGAQLSGADGFAAAAAATPATAQGRRTDEGGGAASAWGRAYSTAASLSHPAAARPEAAVQAAVLEDAAGGGGGRAAAVAMECTATVGAPSRRPATVFKRRDERATTAAPASLLPLRTSYATLFRSQTTTAAGRRVTPAAAFVTRATPATTTSATAAAATATGTVAATVAVGVSRIIPARATPAQRATAAAAAAPAATASAVDIATAAQARARAATTTSATAAGVPAAIPPIGIAAAATAGNRPASRTDIRAVLTDALLFPQEFAVSPASAACQGRPLLREVAGAGAAGGDKRAPTPARQVAPAAPAADSGVQQRVTYVATRFFSSAAAAAAPPALAAAGPPPAAAKSPASVRPAAAAVQLPLAATGLPPPATGHPPAAGFHPAISGLTPRAGGPLPATGGPAAAATGRTAGEAGPAAGGGTAAAAAAWRGVSAGELFCATQPAQGSQEAKGRAEGDNGNKGAFANTNGKTSREKNTNTSSSKGNSSTANGNVIDSNSGAGRSVFNNRNSNGITRNSNVTNNSSRGSGDSSESVEGASGTMVAVSDSRTDASNQSSSSNNTHNSNTSCSSNPTCSSSAEAGVRPRVTGLSESEHSGRNSGSSNAVDPAFRPVSPPAAAALVSAYGAATSSTRGARAVLAGSTSSNGDTHFLAGAAAANSVSPAYSGSARFIPVDAPACTSSSSPPPEPAVASSTLCPPPATAAVVSSTTTTRPARSCCSYSFCSRRATEDAAAEETATRAGAVATSEATTTAAEGDTSEAGEGATRGLAATGRAEAGRAAAGRAAAERAAAPKGGGTATPRTRASGEGAAATPNAGGAATLGTIEGVGGAAATPKAAGTATSSTKAAMGGATASKAGGATARGMTPAGHAAVGGGKPAAGGTAAAGDTTGGARAGNEVEKRCTSASMLSNKIFEEMEGPLRGKPPLIVGSQSHIAHRFFPHLSPVERLPACSYLEDGTPILNPPAGKKNTGREIPLHVRIAMDFRQDQVHPAVLRLGLQMGSRKVEGTNARTVAMLTAFQRFIEDYCPPPYEAMEKHLKIMLDRQINFITHCRPHSLAMGATIRWLKKRVSSCARLPLHETKAALCFYISTFISERIVAATCAVADFLQDLMVCSGDCLLIYGYSTAVVRGLCQARRQGKCFSVIVVDARPYLSGRRAAMELAEAGVETTYTLLNGVAYHMDSVTRVVLGAAALLSNAAVVNRAGAAIVAMVARSYNKPVIVCCELYKTFDRILLDSAAFNELDDPYMVWPETPAEAAAAAAARRGGHTRSARRKSSLPQAAATGAKASEVAAETTAAEEEEEKANKGVENDEGGSENSSSCSASAAARSTHPDALRRRRSAAAGVRGETEGREENEDAAAETEGAADQQQSFRAVESSSNSSGSSAGRDGGPKTAGDSTQNGAEEREEEGHTELSGFSRFRFRRPPRLGAAAAALLSSSLAECNSGPFGGRKKPSRSLADIAAALATNPGNPQPHAAVSSSAQKEGGEAPAAWAGAVAAQENQNNSRRAAPTLGNRVSESAVAKDMTAPDGSSAAETTDSSIATALPAAFTREKRGVSEPPAAATSAAMDVAAVAGGADASNGSAAGTACVGSEDALTHSTGRRTAAATEGGDAAASRASFTSSELKSAQQQVARDFDPCVNSSSSLCDAFPASSVTAAASLPVDAAAVGEGSIAACEVKPPAAGGATAAAHDAKEGSPAGTDAPGAVDGTKGGAAFSAAATAPERKRSAGGRGGGGGGLPAPEICVMNLCYDVTRAEFIDYFITEDGVFPTSNMPVLVHNIAN